MDKPNYQGMTKLSRELEEALISLPYSFLLESLRGRTNISYTDTLYSAVQAIAKAFTVKEVERMIHRGKTLPPDAAPSPPSSPTLTSSSEARTHSSKASTSHPQQVIDAKTAIIKAAGGSIEYSRSVRGWLVKLPNQPDEVWTSEEFRVMTENAIKLWINNFM